MSPGQIAVGPSRTRWGRWFGLFWPSCLPSAGHRGQDNNPIVGMNRLYISGGGGQQSEGNEDGGGGGIRSKKGVHAVGRGFYTSSLSWPSLAFQWQALKAVHCAAGILRSAGTSS